ncbi:hypothetical protein ACFX1S_012373 [Malus domestica]
MPQVLSPSERAFNFRNIEMCNWWRLRKAHSSTLHSVIVLVLTKERTSRRGNPPPGKASTSVFSLKVLLSLKVVRLGSFSSISLVALEMTIPQ